MKFDRNNYGVQPLAVMLSVVASLGIIIGAAGSQQIEERNKAEFLSKICEYDDSLFAIRGDVVELEGTIVPTLEITRQSGMVRSEDLCEEHNTDKSLIPYDSTPDPAISAPKENYKDKVAGDAYVHLNCPHCSKYGIHYNPYDVREPSNMNIEQLRYFVQLQCPDWVGLEEELLAYDSEFNLVFLLSVGRLETWAGQRCVGDYNCFNIVGNTDCGFMNYESYRESIADFVRLIRDAYINPEGTWYEGYGISEIGVHYATPSWAPKVTDCGYYIIRVIERWQDENAMT